MPSVRVKKGYLTLDDSSYNNGRPRSRSLSAAPRAGQEIEMVSRPPPAAHHYSWSSRSIKAFPPPTGRPRALSKVTSHIMLNSRRQLSHRSSDISVPQDTQTGPSRQAVSTAGTLHQRPSRRQQDSYLVEGQQAELRIPNDDNRNLEGSQINLALRQIERQDYDRFDSEDEHHHDDIVEHLDAIDPQVSTVCTLTNAANSIVVPPLSFYSRKPVIVLPRPKRIKKHRDVEKGTGAAEENPHEDALDVHVHDVLHKRDKFRRMMAGVWSFLKTPLGIVTAFYGFNVVFWGCGIVVFLIPLWDVHNDLQQHYWVELCQQVETGLFTVTSIGFIPFRAMDTYRIIKIWYYKRKIIRLRQKAGLLGLYDPDDLPDPAYDDNYAHVLTEREQIDLHYQQHQFMKSQTWYRPHGTQTHRAFPITIALWICICNDLNSFFQCLLSGTMWGLDRFQRPAWTTGITLPAAFVAGIVAGVLIYWGGRKTRRTQHVEDQLRLALQIGTNPNNNLQEQSTSDVPTQQLSSALESGRTSFKTASAAASKTNLASEADLQPAAPLSAAMIPPEEMVVPPVQDPHNQ